MILTKIYPFILSLASSDHTLPRTGKLSPHPKHMLHGLAVVILSSVLQWISRLL